MATTQGGDVREHIYEVDDDDGGRIVFVCPVPGCGRRVVLQRGSKQYVVIDRGDFFAAHSGAVGPLSFTLG
jgi:hypothetical protein